MESFLYFLTNFENEEVLQLDRYCSVYMLHYYSDICELILIIIFFVWIVWLVSKGLVAVPFKFVFDFQ